jgi:hypothetical protein
VLELDHMGDNDKALSGAAMLRKQGHRVEFLLREDENGKTKAWWKVDEDLASTQEMEHIADGIYSFEELHELFVKRRADENRKAAGH